MFESVNDAHGLCLLSPGWYISLWLALQTLQWGSEVVTWVKFWTCWSTIRLDSTYASAMDQWWPVPTTAPTLCGTWLCQTNFTLLLVAHCTAVNVADFDNNIPYPPLVTEPSKSGAGVPVNLFILWMGSSKALPGSSTGTGWLLGNHQIDHTIKLWDTECGTCLNVLEGHEELAQCIHLTIRGLSVGPKMKKIKAWGLQVALEPQQAHCVCTHR